MLAFISAGLSWLVLTGLVLHCVSFTVSTGWQALICCSTSSSVMAFLVFFQHYHPDNRREYQQAKREYEKRPGVASIPGAGMLESVCLLCVR